MSDNMEVEATGAGVNPPLSGDNITVILSNKSEYLMPVEHLWFSGTIKNMCEDLEANIVPLPNVTEKIWALITEYMTTHYSHHVKDVNAYYNNALDPKDQPSWAQQFVSKIDHTSLLELINTANFLEMPGLMDLCGCSLGERMSNKSPEELRKEWNIPNDFTPEEEEAIRQRIQFCEALY